MMVGLLLSPNDGRVCSSLRTCCERSWPVLRFFRPALRRPMLCGTWHPVGPCVTPKPSFRTWSSLVACVPRTQLPCTAGYCAPLGCGRGPAVGTGSSVVGLVLVGGSRQAQALASSSRLPCVRAGSPAPGCTRHLLARATIPFHTPSKHKGEQEPSGTGHCRRNTTHRACAPVNRDREAQDIAHATQQPKHHTHRNTAQHTDRTHQKARTKCPRTPHTQHSTQHTSTAEKRRQKAQETAHATPHTERASLRRGAKWPRTRHKQHNTTSPQTGDQEPNGPGRRINNTAHRACKLVNRS